MTESNLLKQLQSFLRRAYKIWEIWDKWAFAWLCVELYKYNIPTTSDGVIEEPIYVQLDIEKTMCKDCYARWYSCNSYKTSYCPLWLSKSVEVEVEMEVEMEVEIKKCTEWYRCGKCNSYQWEIVCYHKFCNNCWAKIKRVI